MPQMGSLMWVGNKYGARVVVPFEGRCITRVYSKAPNRGNVEVRIDPVFDGPVNQTYSEYSPTVIRRVQRQFCAGSSGKHVIEFRTICSAPDCFFDVDEFFVDTFYAVAAAQVQAADQSGKGTIYQEDHEAVTYIGDWKSFKAEDASNGSLSFTENQRASFNISFEGSQVEYCYANASNRGKASILIDGEYVETIDLYGSETERNQCWVSPELEQGVHYLHVAATGEKNENSSGTLIDLDHFIVH